MTPYLPKGLGFLVVLAASTVAMPVAAQYNGGNTPTVRCDSNDNHYRQCAADTRNGAQLLRQYSKNACVEGRTWGYDRNGVWVNGGCRAEFALVRAGWGGGNGNGGNGGSGGNGGNGNGRSVRCDSNDNRYVQCQIDGRSAYLVRQVSKSPCIEGRTWGTGRGFVWVDEGCRAEFASGYDGGHGGGNGGGNGGGWNGGGNGGGAQAQKLYCGSDDRRQRRCNVTIRRDARLVRQASKAPCIEGQSWGWDRNGVWVSNGCRGDFSVL
ncbi:DUF3011 domain-containing protein [Lysobacter sp. S4-A87]|uniref:DUF3011 domain-containing protein n=1 Tax=Lysobacter sp. S4-A87 TaxID=2925843 RepID=UPI001F52EEF7|nr:DUF3011 domain-containing protein [Lysobacter sp. S4-A87]UNK50093.1 DUF3011 domain-containing protein [Lysobacter sp. S4-A87]